MIRKISHWKYAVALCLMVLGTIGILAYGVWSGDGKLASAVYAQADPDITAREAMVNGRSVGEVLVGDKVVLRIRSSAGGLSPFRRSQIVADRLSQFMGDSVQPEDITTGIVNGQEVVLAGGQILVTADTTHAKLNGTTPTILAQQWANNLRTAFGAEPLAATADTVDVPTSQKIVPIISVGSGTRIGGAQVTGPNNYVSRVVAVAQIEGNFAGSVRVRVLVPVSTENVVQNITRVPQTSVTALVDIKI